MEVVRKYVDASRKATDIEHALQSLAGVIPYTDMTLEELREERLRKYENIFG